MKKLGGDKKIVDLTKDFEELYDIVNECVAIYEVKENGEKFFFKSVNKSLEKLEKVSNKKLVGRDVEEIFPGIEDMGLLDIFKRVWKTGKPEKQEPSKYVDNKRKHFRENFIYKLPCGDIVSTYREVPDKEGLKKQIWELEDTYKKICAASKDSLIILNPNKTFIAANSSAIKLFEFKNEKELLKKSLDDLFPKYQPDKRLSSKKAEEEIKKAIENGSNFFKWTHKTIKNKEFSSTVLLTKIIIKGESFLQISIRDTSKKEEMERLLKKNMLLIERTQKIGKVGGWHFDINNMDLQFSKELFRIYNINSEKTPSIKKAISYFTSECRPKITKALEKCLNTGERYDLELKFKAGKKEEIWVRAVGEADLENGKIIGMVGFLQDITDKKHTEEKLKNNEELISAFMNSAIDGFIIFDSKLNLLGFNQAALKLGSIKEKAIIGKNITNLLPGIKKTSRYKKYMQVLKTGKPTTFYHITRENKEGRRHILKKVFRVGEGIGIISTDVTEKISIEEKLKESENLLANTNKLLKVGGWTLDTKTMKGTWTDEVAKIYGLPPIRTPDPELGISLYDSESKSIIKKAVKSAIEKGTPYDLKLGIVTPGGVHKWVRTTGKANYNNKEIVGLSGTFQDITEKKEAEEKLKESNEGYKELFKSMVNSFALHEIILDKKGVPINYRYLDANMPFGKMIGMPLNKIIGKNVTEILPTIKKDSTDWVSIYGKVALTRKAIYFESYSELLDKWFSISAYSPKKGQFATIIEDISNSKERALENEKLSKIYEQSPILIILTDPKGNIEYVNPKFTEVTGYKSKEVIGKNPRILKSGKTSVEEYSRLWEAIGNGETWKGELHNKKKDGHTYWADATISPILGENGEIINIIGMQQDITETKKSMEGVLRFNNLAVNRELKMIELKQEINNLLKKSGKAPKYSEK